MNDKEIIWIESDGGGDGGDDDAGDPFVRQKYAHHMLPTGFHYNQGLILYK